MRQPTQRVESKHATNKKGNMQVLNIHRSRQITKRPDLLSSGYLCYVIDISKTCKAQSADDCCQDELHKS